MKKFVSVFSVIMLVVNILLLALSCITLFPSEGMGAWLVSLYEGITNQVGATADAIYGKFRIICNWGNLIAMGLTWILVLCMSSYIRKHECSPSDETKTEEEQKPVVEPEAKMSRSEKVKAARHLKDGKKTAEVVKKAVNEAVKSALVTVVEETSNEPVTEAQISAEEQFLASLRKK